MKWYIGSSSWIITNSLPVCVCCWELRVFSSLLWGNLKCSQLDYGKLQHREEVKLSRHCRTPQEGGWALVAGAVLLSYACFSFSQFLRFSHRNQWTLWSRHLFPMGKFKGLPKENCIREQNLPWASFAPYQMSTTNPIVFNSWQTICHLKAIDR